MSLRATILGCGSSAGVPRVGLGWGACDPKNPKNRRRRCSLLVERRGPGGVTRVLVDTSPDVREQLLEQNVDHVDAVLFTHEHADHLHGIDDLRPLALRKRDLIDVFADDATAAVLRGRFGYCFETPPGSSYPPILRLGSLEAESELTINGAGGPLTALPFRQEHGDISSLGFRFGGLGYSSDLNGLPADSKAALAGLDVWIIDALRYTGHPSHFSVSEALGAIAEVRPRRAVLTNLHTDLDYDKLKRELPPGIEPAFDGMQLTLD